MIASDKFARQKNPPKPLAQHPQSALLGAHDPPHQAREQRIQHQHTQDDQDWTQRLGAGQPIHRDCCQNGKHLRHCLWGPFRNTAHRMVSETGIAAKALRTSPPWIYTSHNNQIALFA